jgi:pimeloyl-ACP methyl ester carboxylesterase
MIRIIVILSLLTSLHSAETSVQVSNTRGELDRARNTILQAMQQVMGPLPAQGRVPAYLLIPKGATNSPNQTVGVLCLHQTHPLGNKVVVGLGNSPNDEYAVELVKRGYVCLAPAYPLLSNYAPDLRALGYSSGTMKAIWDNMRGLDFLESLPSVRKGHFGVIGHSLGGHNGLFTAAFDDRVKVVVTSCGFDSFRDYKGGNIEGWTSERYMPRLLTFTADTRPFDFDDVLRAIAPRTVFINAPVGDTNFGWKSVDRMVSSARAQVPTDSFKIVVEHPDAGHRFPPEIRAQAYAVMDGVLRPGEARR